MRPAQIRPFVTPRASVESNPPALAELGFVRTMRPFTPEETVSGWELLRIGFTEDKRIELLAHEARGVDAIVSWFRSREVPLELVAGRKVRFINDREPGLIAEVAAHPEVARLYPFVDPVPCNDHASALVGAGGDGAAPSPAFPWTGAGQLVGVADSGVDLAHADLSGRLASAIAHARPGDVSDLTGHGTHVTGSIVGTGASSAGAIRGIAPGAHVVFQSIGGLREGFVVGSMVDVLREAYQLGARVHCDSWGLPKSSGYEGYATEVDEFVRDHPDMLVVIAAGNTGTAAAPVNTQPGWVDLMSVTSPGTAKNALTVGASRSDRQPVGPPLTWGEWSRTNFPLAPVADEPLSGDPERLAALSARGPCDDQARIKPDVVAPGTLILSTRAGGTSGSRWASLAPPGYAYECGTSMATAIVAGCALRVREYLVEDRGHEPSAALLKAVLVNGARWLAGADAVAGHDSAPNYHQGFGRVWLPGSVPSPSSGLTLEFVDAWADPSLDINASGRGFRFALVVEDDAPLRLCLAWTDLPRRSVQNSLGFKIEQDRGNAAWFGNEHKPGLRSTFDRNNNVQVVRIDRAEAGSYSVFVEAGIVMRGPQRFALAVTGAAGLRLEPISSY